MDKAANRIQTLLDLKGWSHYELSKQTGIVINTIYDWFKIGAVPTLHNIVKICEAMNITLEQFFCDGEYRYTNEENEILKDWFSMTDLEKSTIMNLIETFKILKNG